MLGLYSRARKIRQNFGFDLPNCVFVVAEEEALKPLLEEIISKLGPILDETKAWGTHAEICQNFSEKLDRFHRIIKNNDDLFVQLIGCSFGRLLDADEMMRKGLVQRIKTVFENNKVYMHDDNVLDLWFQERIQKDGIRDLAPQHANRIFWQGLLVSPLKWSTRFQEIFETILSAVAFSVDDERAWASFPEEERRKLMQLQEDSRKMYSPVLLKQLRWLLKIAKNPSMTIRPQLFVSCNLEDVELIENIEDFSKALSNCEPGQRLNLIRGIDFPEAFVTPELFESPLLKEIPESDWLEAMDYLLEKADLSRVNPLHVILAFEPKIKAKKKLQKDFSDRALRKYPEAHANSGVRRLFVTMPAGIFFSVGRPDRDLVLCMGCFPVEDRLEVFKHFAQLIGSGSIAVFHSLRKQDWPAALVAKKVWYDHEKLKIFIPFLNLLAKHKENLWSLYFKQLAQDPSGEAGERIRGIFSLGQRSLPNLDDASSKEAAEAPVLFCLKTLPVDSYLPFLEALAPYFDFAFDPKLFFDQYFPIYNAVLPHLNEADREKFIVLTAESVKCREGCNPKKFAQFLEPLEEAERWNFVKSSLDWLQAKSCETIFLMEYFSESEWPALNEIFKWDLEKEKILPKIFELPQSLWEKALQFLGIPRESLKEIPSLAKILVLTRGEIRQNNTCNLPSFLTGTNSWHSLISSTEDLLGLLDAILKQEDSLPETYSSERKDSELYVTISCFLAGVYKDLINIVKTAQNYFKLLEKVLQIPSLSSKGRSLDSHERIAVFLDQFISSQEDYNFAIGWLCTHEPAAANNQLIVNLHEIKKFHPYRDRNQYGKILKGLIAQGAQVKALMPVIAQGFKDFAPPADNSAATDFLVQLYENVGPQYMAKALEVLAAAITQPPQHPLKADAEIQCLIDRGLGQDQKLLDSIALSSLHFLGNDRDLSDCKAVRQFYKGGAQAWRMAILTCLIETGTSRNLPRIHYFLTRYHLQIPKAEFNAFIKLLCGKLPLEDFLFLIRFDKPKDLKKLLIQRFLAEISDTEILEEFYKATSPAQIIDAVGYLTYLKTLDRSPDFILDPIRRALHWFSFRFSTQKIEGKIRISSLEEVVGTFKLMPRSDRHELLENLQGQINFDELQADINSFFEWIKMGADFFSDRSEQIGLRLVPLTAIKSLMLKRIKTYGEYATLVNLLEEYQTSVTFEDEQEYLKSILKILRDYFMSRPEIFSHLSELVDFGVFLLQNERPAFFEFMKKFSPDRLASLCDFSKPIQENKLLNLTASVLVLMSSGELRSSAAYRFFLRVTDLSSDSTHPNAYYATYKKAWEKGSHIEESLQFLLRSCDTTPKSPGVFQHVRAARANMIIENLPRYTDLKSLVEYLGEELAQAENPNPRSEEAMRLHWAISALAHPESFKKEFAPAPGPEASVLMLGGKK